MGIIISKYINIHPYLLLAITYFNFGFVLHKKVDLSSVLYICKGPYGNVSD
jgi:hypothetical protein